MRVLAIVCVSAFTLGATGTEEWTAGLGAAWRWAHLPAHSEDAGNQIKNLVEASDGTLWLSASKGSYWYDRYSWVAGKGLPERRIPLAAGRQAELLAVTAGTIYAGGRYGFEPLAGPDCKVDAAYGPFEAGLLLSCDQRLGWWGAQGWKGARPTVTQRGVAGQTIYVTGDVAWWSDETGLHRWAKGVDRLFLAAPRRGRSPFYARSLAENSTGDGILTVDSPAELRGLWEWFGGGAPRRVAAEGASLAVAAGVHRDGTALIVYQSGHVRIRQRGVWSDAGVVPEFLRRARHVRFLSSGDLLVGTAERVYRFSPGGSRWQLHQHAFPDPRNTVNDLLMAADGSTWLATADGVEVVRKDGRREWIRQLGSDRLIVCTGVAQDARGDIWLTSGLAFGGAWRFDGSSWKHFGSAQGLTNQKLHKASRAASGALWFSSTGYGVGDTAEGAGAWRWDGKRFERISEKDGLESNRVYQVEEAKDGTLWVASTSALSRRSARGDRWRHWRKERELAAEASPFALTVLPSGELFFADRTSGLGRVDAQGTVRYYRERDGLATAEVWGVKAGGDGAVWVTTSGGLSLWREGTLSKLTEVVGGLGGHLWPLATRDGKVCAGSIGNGWGCLDTATQESLPQVRLAKILTTEDAVIAEWKVATPWSDPNPDLIETRTRLDGLPWSDWSLERRREMRSLPPGAHRLEVQAKGLMADLSPAAVGDFDYRGPLHRRPEFVVPVVLLLVLAGGLLMVLTRRRQEHARHLANREARFRALLERSADGVMVCTPAGDVEYLSGGAARLLDAASIEGMGFADWVDGRDANAVGQGVAAALREPGFPQEVHFRVRRSGVRLLQALITNRLGEPEVAGVVVNLRDVTAELEGRRALEEAKERAEAASRAKSEFLATMSHEIRTPMNGILGMASLLLATSADDDQNESALTIRDSCRSLLTLLNDILDISRIEAGGLVLERVPFHLRGCVDEIARLLNATATEKGIRLEVCAAEGQPEWFWGDPGRIRQVMLNLAGNAVKFTGAGSVVMEIAVMPVGGRYQVRCAVRDTGIGIPPEKVAQVFEKFVQADASTTRQYGGTGLGLAICKSLVELMGGTIRAESEVGIGSTFAFEMVLEAAPAGVDAAVRLPGTVVPGLRVLLAEDNAVNQRVAGRMLERLGCVVTLAENGTVAVTKSEQAMFDLVLMDCQMPVMDGFTAAREMRRQGFERPIIALTANNMVGDRDRCLVAGMDDFLSKPMELEELARMLERWSLAVDEGAQGTPVNVPEGDRPVVPLQH